MQSFFFDGVEVMLMNKVSDDLVLKGAIWIDPDFWDLIRTYSIVSTYGLPLIQEFRNIRARRLRRGVRRCHFANFPRRFHP